MFYENIRACRNARNWSQSYVASRLGISRASVNAWEMGDSYPSVPLLIKMAGLFRVTTDYLLGIDNSSNININNLKERDIKIIFELIDRFDEK